MELKKNCLVFALCISILWVGPIYAADEKFLFDFQDDVVCNLKIDDNFAGFYVFKRFNDHIELSINGKKPIRFNGYINFDGKGRFQGVIPNGTSDIYQMGDSAKDDTYLVYTPDEKNSQYLKTGSKGKNVAYAIYDHGKWRMVINGKKGEPFDFVDPPVFSENGEHVAYPAKKNKKYVMIIDGKKGPKFDTLFKNFPRFDKKGEKSIYVGAIDNKEYAVFNNNKSNGYDEIFLKTVYISPDGETYFFIAKDKGKFFSVRNGKEGKKYDALKAWPVISENGKKIAFGVGEKDKSLVVFNGKEHTKYDKIDIKLLLDKKGKRLLYPASTNNKWLAVDNGKESKAYDEAYWIQLSENGEKSSYAFKNLSDDKLYVYLNGKLKWKHKGSVSRPLIFSPDSRHTAYVIKQGQKRYVIKDGKKEMAIDQIMDPFFSHDSKKLVYGAVLDGGHVVVLNNKVIAKYDTIYDYKFGPDNDLAIIGVKNKKIHLFINKKTVGIYDNAFRSSSTYLNWNHNNTLEVIAGKGNKVFKIVAKP